MLRKIIFLIFFFVSVLLLLSNFSAAESITYQYDSLNRLTRAEYSDGSVIAYTYDAAGNRLSLFVQAASYSWVDGLPAAGSTYVMGSAPVGSFITATFTLKNKGTASLILSGNPLVAISGTHASEFTVSQPPTSPVAPGASTTFTLRFTPAATGERTATVSIANNDSNNNPYTFMLTGTGQAQGPNSYLLWTR